MALEKKLTLAVIGAGYWGFNIIRAFYQHPRVQLRFVCDTDEIRRQAIKGLYPSVQTVSEIDAILADSSVKAIAICTPTESHYLLAKKCLEHNKHVFVEKPLATKAVHCLELIRLAQEKNRRLLTGHIFLYNPAVEHIYQLIQTGELGKIIYIACKRVNLGPVRQDVDVLWDLGPHDISICNFWLQDSPYQGQAVGLQHNNNSLSDVVFASLRYGENVLVNLHLSWLDGKKIRQIFIVGTNKTVVFDDLDPMGPVQVCEAKASPAAPSSASIQTFKAPLQGGCLSVPKLSTVEPLAKECEEFIESILDNKPITSDGIVGWEVVNVLEALSLSLKEGGIQHPIKPEANRSLGLFTYTKQGRNNALLNQPFSEVLIPCQ